MTRWRCARWCCEAFTQPTDHQPSHLCAKTGAVEAYVPDTAPATRLAAVADLIVRRHLQVAA